MTTDNSLTRIIELLDLAMERPGGIHRGPLSCITAARDKAAALLAEEIAADSDERWGSGTGQEPDPDAPRELVGPQVGENEAQLASNGGSRALLTDAELHYAARDAQKLAEEQPIPRDYLTLIERLNDIEDEQDRRAES